VKEAKNTGIMSDHPLLKLNLIQCDFLSIILLQHLGKDTAALIEVL
jgi:hypothetical protein